MKKTLQSVAIAATMLLATTASAQLPDDGIYPGGLVLESYAPSAGYTGNHIYEMGTWNIDSILDSGTPVILDLFATWCNPCWTYHEGGTLESLYDSQGWGSGATIQDGNIAIFAIEADGSTAANLLEASSRDWVKDTKYPMVNHNGAAGMMNLSYYPTIIMICPDRQVTEMGQATEVKYIAASNGCGSAAQFANDPAITKSTTAAKSFACQTPTASVPVSVMIQNHSTAAINTLYTVKLFDAANAEVATVDVTLNLAAYAVQNVVIGSLNLTAGSHAFTAKISTANDDLTNDDISITVEVVDAIDLEIAPNMGITIQLDMDAYAKEVGFALVEGIPSGSPATVYAAANTGNSIAYVQDADLPNGTAASDLQTYSSNFTIANLGCHYFVTYDDYGDGIVYQNASGEARLISSGTTTIAGDWNAGTVVAYEFIAGPAGINEEANLNALSIFPNPANEVANVSLALTETSTVTISVVNALGQSVAVQNLGLVNGTQNVQVNTSNLEAGMYLVNVTVNGVVSTERISIVK